jgi:hypothetical protein
MLFVWLKSSKSLALVMKESAGIQVRYDCVGCVRSSQTSGISRSLNRSSFHLSHCVQSKPRYSIASGFVKPIWFRPPHSANEQRRSISTSKGSRGKRKFTCRFGFMNLRIKVAIHHRQTANANEQFRQVRLCVSVPQPRLRPRIAGCSF